VCGGDASLFSITLDTCRCCSNLFLEQLFAVLGGQVEQESFVAGALCVDATQRDVGVVAVAHSVDVRADHVTVVRQRVEQLLQPLQTYSIYTSIIVIVIVLLTACSITYRCHHEYSSKQLQRVADIGTRQRLRFRRSLH